MSWGGFRSTTTSTLARPGFPARSTASAAIVTVASAAGKGTSTRNEPSGPTGTSCPPTVSESIGERSVTVPVTRTLVSFVTRSLVGLSIVTNGPAESTCTSTWAEPRFPAASIAVATMALVAASVTGTRAR